MDTVKEAVDTIFYRARSPLFGSLLLSFFGYNWKPFTYLFLAERPLRSRFIYFENNIDVFWPVVIGLAIFAIAPIGKLAGSIVAEWPMHFMRMRQLNFDNLYETKKLHLENERRRALGEAEQQLIDQTKRDLEVEALPEKERDDLQAQIDDLRHQQKSGIKLQTGSISKSISDTGLEIIQKLGKSGRNRITFRSLLKGGRTYSIDEWSVNEESDKREFANTQSAIEELLQDGYIRAADDTGHSHELSKSGFELYDRLTSQGPPNR